MSEKLLRDPHPFAGKTVTLKSPDPEMDGAEYRVEDWWENVGGQSWGAMQGNPACLVYAMRLIKLGYSPDDEVVYGKIGAFGHLVHVKELGNPVDMVNF